MKKKILSFLGILAVVVLLTGCGKDLITQVNENMSDVTNGIIEMKMNMKFDAEGLSLEIPFDISAKVFGDKTYMTMKMSFMGETMTTEMYGLISGNKETLYTKDSESNKWVKTEETVDEVSGAFEEELFNIVSNASDVKELTDESKGDVKVYEATFTKAELEKILTELLTDDTFEFDIKNNSTIKFSVNTKTKLLETLSLNFEDALVMNAEGIEFRGGFTLDITFKELNKVADFDIPKEVLDTK